MDIEKNLKELCETIEQEIEAANKKIRAADGKLSGDDLGYLDKLTHTLKSIKSSMKMIKEHESEGYSSTNYYDGRMMHDYSNARRRDSMGRYSRRGYSYHDGMIDELRGLMEDAPDDRIRQKFHKFISEIESM